VEQLRRCLYNAARQTKTNGLGIPRDDVSAASLMSFALANDEILPAFQGLNFY
jgi:hypothetical protein